MINKENHVVVSLEIQQEKKIVKDLMLKLKRKWHNFIAFDKTFSFKSCVSVLCLYLSMKKVAHCLYHIVIFQMHRGKQCFCSKEY